MSYTDRLRDWLSKQEKHTKKRQLPLIQFLALKNDIAEALNNGHTRKEIWTHLTSTGEIKCRYPTFTKYVAEVITNVTTEATEDQEQQADQQQAAPTTAKEENRKKIKKSVSAAKPEVNSLNKKFNFNSNPNDEELF